MSRLALRLTLTGISPLLMHAGSLLDPMHPIKLELDAYHEKPVKTADDHRRIADLEFVGALWQAGGRPCLPARTLQAVVREAADRGRGVQHRVRAAIFVEDDVPLLHEGPSSVDGLAQDPEFRMRTQVRQNDGSRRMCTRPCFPRWSASVAFAYDAGIIGRADLVDLVMTAGDDVGIGAGRPRYGRFAVTPTAD